MPNKNMKTKKVVLLILLLSLNTFCTVNFLCLSVSVPDIWQSDSTFVGAGVVTSTKEIFVTFDTSVAHYKGNLYAILPDSSSVFLFDTRCKAGSTISLGKFKEGEQIFFMFHVLDNVEEFEQLYMAKLYSGQNRKNIEPYVCEARNGIFQYRWFAAGRLNDSTIQAGFNNEIELSHGAIVFTVNNVYVEGVEKYKCPKPVLNIIGQNLELSALDQDNIRYDATIGTNFLPAGKSFKIYYTLDGSDPEMSVTRKVYLSPITIDKDVILKAISTVDSVPSWYPSDILCKNVLKDNVNIIKKMTKRQNKSKIQKVDFYNILGKKVNSRALSENQIIIERKGLQLVIRNPQQYW